MIVETTVSVYQFDYPAANGAGVPTVQNRRLARSFFQRFDTSIQ
jgi:hypothetical protein